LIRYRAGWILPISAAPIRAGFVILERGRIVAVSAHDAPFLGSDESQNGETVDLGDVAVLPGLVNAHTHLELSWMRGRVAPSASMPAWAGSLMALRREHAAEPLAPIETAIKEVREAGTALVGDVTNTLAPDQLLRHSPLGGAMFYEVLGFSAPEPEQVVRRARAVLNGLPADDEWSRTIVPHAPYSVSPSLFRAIGSAAGNAPMSVHIGESRDEMEFLRTGTGAWRELLGHLGAWNDRWQPPGCGPVEYLDRLGLLNDRLIAVHGTQLPDRELARLVSAGATLVTCPRSNTWTGAGPPPIDRFYASGVRVAIGTDSLASVEDLNLFQELACVRRLAPHVPAGRLLESATIAGATALGFGKEFGTIEVGKRAALIAVRVPRSVEDVEEYLVSGIQPDTITWLETDVSAEC
jgi:cytosine/adenosine deaminase-related metal-dependent hydrolase